MKDETLNILGIAYVHRKTSDGGDIYFTEHGLKWSEHLNIENWYEKSWFSEKSERLQGTSAVFKVPTKEVDGKVLRLVVKNCRVGEDVPVDTHILEQFVNAEFNSPWEEFSLVTELRTKPQDVDKKQIITQNPLAIYIPPERLQLWQTGRSRNKINKINRRHPGIELDILRQYKLIYQWIDGLDVVQALEELGLKGQALDDKLEPITTTVLDDLAAQEFSMADMKAVHIIVPEECVLGMRVLFEETKNLDVATKFIDKVIEDGRYAIIDYELLLRTPKHEARVKQDRRNSYLDVQRDRFVHAPLPEYLVETKIMGVPYVHGKVESTGGLLWVVGRNSRLYDYFLPERWRKTPSRALSKLHEVYYTLTKDNVHIVWRTSRVGEMPDPESCSELFLKKGRGFNSPVEEFAIATQLQEAGIPCVYVRAIYMTGSTKVEGVSDTSRFESHRDLCAIDGSPILRENRNYISIRGFYNGPDSWVAEQVGALYEPIDLIQAIEREVFSEERARKLFTVLQEQLQVAGFCGDFLSLNNVLIARRPDGIVVLNAEGQPETRISNFEAIYKL